MTSLLAAKIEARYGQNGFPVNDCLDDLVEALGRETLVALTAPPGSGKTMVVPAALLERLGARRVYVLEPRRVTARLPALALSEVCGQTVGYQIRFERKWDSGATRFGYLTYGTALRVFASSPPGPQDLVLFDEFHERQWEAELLLAYLRSLQSGPKLLLMSATLDRESLPAETPVIQSDGRLHQVSVSHEKVEPQLMGRRDRLAQLVAQRSAEWAVKARGEQLIFLPGIGDIRAVEERLLADHLSGPVDILHSSLPEKEIRRVVERKAQDGFRRILSTDLAESSVTLPGIKVVIDSGLVRRPRRDELDLGVTLRTVGAPLSSLHQRAGRAGRLGPGFCHRVFTLNEELHREPFAPPQMEEASYKTVCLFLASLGLLSEWTDLPWLYKPNESRLEKSRNWATKAGLLKGDVLNETGRRVLGLPLDARLATFAVKAGEGGHAPGRIVSWCQALERPPGERESWLLEDWSKKVEQDQRLTRQLTECLKEVSPGTRKSLSHVLLESFGDTLAQPSADRAVCANPEQPAVGLNPKYPAQSELAVLLSAVPSGGRGPSSFCTLFQPVEPDAVWEQMFEDIEESRHTFFDPATKSVRLKREIRLKSLLLESHSEPAPPGPETAAVLQANLTADDLGPEYALLKRRLELFKIHNPETSLPSSEELVASFLESVSSWKKSSGDDLVQFIHGLLGYGVTSELDRQLPVAVELPGRRKPVRVIYPEDGEPYVASKLQDFMGWQQPRLMDGKLSLVCHLLAPNGRPCQITTDLNSFWSGSYQQVRKDLRGRYPKHHWPEDPARNPQRQRK